MSKAVLLLDEMPEECEDCPLFYNGDFGRECQLVNIKGQKKPKWCPLKELPERKTMTDVVYSTCTNGCSDVIEAYRKGWNDCMDEVGGKDSFWHSLKEEPDKQVSKRYYLLLPSKPDSCLHCPLCVDISWESMFCAGLQETIVMDETIKRCPIREEAQE